MVRIRMTHDKGNSASYPPVCLARVETKMEAQNQANVDDLLKKAAGSKPTITIRHWIIFAFIAFLVQAIPMYFFWTVRELYPQTFILLYVGMIITGTAFLTYAYASATGVRARKLRASNQKASISQSSLYGIFFGNAVYLIAFTCLLKLVSFNSITVSGHLHNYNVVLLLLLLFLFNIGIAWPAFLLLAYWLPLFAFMTLHTENWNDHTSNTLSCFLEIRLSKGQISSMLAIFAYIEFSELVGTRKSITSSQVVFQFDTVYKCDTIKRKREPHLSGNTLNRRSIRRWW